MTYHFKTTDDNRVQLVTEYNTRILHLDARNRIRPLASAKSYLKYYWYQHSGLVRHYVGLTRMFREFSC